MLSDIQLVFTTNILPIFVVVGIGFCLRRFAKIDYRPLSKIVFYALGPALSYVALTQAALPGHALARLMLFGLLMVLIMGALGWILSRVLRFNRAEGITLTLLVAFVNAGSYGLTVSRLRYDELGVSHAIGYFIATSLLLYTLGVFLASLGRRSFWETCLNMFRFPAVYGVVLAIFVRTTGWHLPAAVDTGFQLASEGAIPVLILVLGMQLADLRHFESWRLTVPAVFMRLLVAPVVAVALTGLMGFSQLDRAVSVIMASMPSAIIVAVLATEFELLETAATSAVLLSTLLSPLTIPLVIILFHL